MEECEIRQEGGQDGPKTESLARLGLICRGSTVVCTLYESVVCSYSTVRTLRTQCGVSMNIRIGLCGLVPDHTALVPVLPVLQSPESARLPVRVMSLRLFICSSPDGASWFVRSSGKLEFEALYALLRCHSNNSYQPLTITHCNYVQQHHSTIHNTCDCSIDCTYCYAALLLHSARVPGLWCVASVLPPRAD